MAEGRIAENHGRLRQERSLSRWVRLRVQIPRLWETIPGLLQAHRGEPRSLSWLLVACSARLRWYNVGNGVRRGMHLDIRNNPQQTLPLIIEDFD